MFNTAAGHRMLDRVSSRRGSSRWVATIILFISSVPGSLAAQLTTGTVRGQIVDSTNGAVRGAAVTLINSETDNSQAALSDDRGLYAFARVTPGRYHVDVSKEGFSLASRTDVVVTVNEGVAVDFVLQVGSVAVTVDVHGEQSPIHTQGVELGGLVDERRIRELPLNGKNFQRLVYTAPGASLGAGADSNPAIAGTRRTHNNYMIDGLSFNNERLPNGIAGVNGLGSDFLTDLPNLVSTEAIREFRIISANADATFGRSSGGQIDIVTKSGTNRRSGSTYEFARDNHLDARDYFNRGPFFDASGNPVVPPFRQNLFGGTLGGPIVSGRHFFFASYEGLRQNRREQSAISTVVPNADLINLSPGDLGRFLSTFFFDRGIVPRTGNAAGTFAPLSEGERAAAVAAGFPAAQFDGNPVNGEAGTVLISAAPRRDIRQDAALIRTDHQWTSRLGASVRYAWADSTTLSGNSAIDTDRTQSDKRYQSAMLQMTYVLSGGQMLDGRVGFQRNTFESQLQGGIDPRLVNLGVSNVLGVLVRVTSPSLTVGTGSPFLDNQTTPQASVTHLWSRGAMTLRSGIDVRWYRIGVTNLNSAQPQFSFANIVGPNGIIGAAPGQLQAVSTSASVSAFGYGGGPTTPLREYRSGQQEAFSQLDWRVRPDVTINSGIRYALFAVYREQHNALSNLYVTDAAGQPLKDRSTNVLGPTGTAIALTSADTPYYQRDRNNLEPRLGVAWNVGNQGRRVVRAGYGIFHDRLIQIQFSGAVANPPLAASSNAANVPFLLGVPVPLELTQFPAVTAVNPAIVNPWTELFNVAFEQRLGATSSITTAYVGSRGHDLFATTQTNGGAGVPQALRPDPRYSRVALVDNLAQSRYHSLQITGVYRRRFFDLTAAYTLASARDDASTEFRILDTVANTGGTPAAGFQGGGAQFERIPVGFDWGPADFDVRHTLSLTHLIELPFGRGRPLLSASSGVVNALAAGWSLAGLVMWRTGEPVNLTLGRDANDDGDTGNDRPVLGAGSIAALYAAGRLGRTQYLVSQSEALTKLSAADKPDPSLWVSRNALRAPGVQFVDLSIIKHIPLRERAGLSIELNVFNLFNRLNLAPPIANLADTRFGQILSTRPGTNPRQIQLGARATF
jgi:carboxypeptidase family protein